MQVTCDLQLLSMCMYRYMYYMVYVYIVYVISIDMLYSLLSLHSTGWGPRSIAFSCLKKVVEFYGLW